MDKLKSINFHINGKLDRWNEQLKKGKEYIKSTKGVLTTQDQQMYHWLWVNAVKNYDKLSKGQKRKIKTIRNKFGL